MQTPEISATEASVEPERTVGGGSVVPPVERTWWIAKEIVPQEPMLRDWLRARVGSEAEADDVIHETYAALAALPCVEGIVAPPAYAVAVAQAILKRRRATIAPQTGLNEASSARATALDEMDADGRARLSAAAASLPVTCRETFQLRMVEGLELSAVAHRLGLSRTAVEAQMAEALGLLMSGLRGRRSSH